MYHIWRMSRVGTLKFHRAVPDRAHAQRIAEILNENNYPKRLYYVVPAVPARPRPDFVKRVRVKTERVKA